MVKAFPGRLLLLLAVMTAPVLLTGCFAMEKDLDPIRSDVAILEKQFVDMSRDVAQVRQRVEEGSEVPPKVADQLKDSQSRIAAIEKRLSIIEAQAPAAPQPIAPEPVVITPMEETPKAPAPAPSPSQPPDIKPGDTLYNESLKALESGDYKKAEAGFTDFLVKNPTGGKVPDALYNLGEAYEKMGQPDKARDTFNRLMDNYPYSDAAKKAHLRPLNKK